MGAVVAGIDATSRAPEATVVSGQFRTETLLLVSALALSTIGQGGYYRRVDWACGLLLAVAAGFIAAHRDVRVLRPAGLALGGVAFMAGCTLITALVDGHVAASRGTFALLAEVAVVITIASSAEVVARRQLADVVIGLGAFLALSGWVGVAFRISPFGHADGGLWRAATTVTYANAAAAMLGLIALWALARCVSDGRNQWKVATVVLIGGLGATLSRAGIAAFAVGFVVLAGLIGVRRMASRCLGCAAGGLVVLGALLPGMRASGPGRPVVAIAGLVGGLVVGLMPWDRVARRLWDHRGRGLLAVGVVLASAGVAGGLLASRSAVWSGRVGLASPDRTSLASVAWHMFAVHPLSGVGPGRALFEWATGNTHSLVMDRYAHDEYLQTAAEQGVIGLVGVLALFAGIAAASARRLKERGRLDDRALAAAALAGLVCFAIQSGFDFLWHVPSVPLLAAVAVGLAAPTPERALELYPSRTRTEEVE